MSHRDHAGMRSLPDTSRRHNERIHEHVARLPDLAEMIGRRDDPALPATYDAECGFIAEQLLPHMATVERALYAELERLMEHRHSMAPMREEHAAVRRLAETLGEARPRVAGGSLSAAEAIGLRRALYRLYALMKVHLAEEELYLSVLDHNLSNEEKDVLAGAIDHACETPL